MLDKSRARAINSHALRYALLASAICITLAQSAFSGTLPLSILEEKLASSLRLKALETQIDYAHHVLRQEKAKEGMQITGKLDIGHHRQIVTNSLTRDYNALQPHIGLTYPLLGGRAQQLEAIKSAQTQTWLNSIELEEVRRQLLHELRSQYILYWQYSQAEQLTGKYLESLNANKPAADKMHEKGMWTGSEFLHFNTELTAAREEQQRFQSQQRMALNAMHSILGSGMEIFQPVRPELPALCLSSIKLNLSAEKHSANLRKLNAQLEALVYSREIGAGSSVNADLHLGMAYIDEYSGNRRGYAATAGVSINMPASFQEAERANRDRLNAAIVVNRTMVEQERLNIQLSTAQAYENLKLAESRLYLLQAQAQTAREALRESRMQFEQMPYPVFNELILKITQEYQASMSETESNGQMLQRTGDLLLLAPDSCASTDIPVHDSSPKKL